MQGKLTGSGRIDGAGAAWGHIGKKLRVYLILGFIRVVFFFFFYSGAGWALRL